MPIVNREDLLAKIGKMEAEMDKAYLLLIQRPPEPERERLKDLIKVLQQHTTELRADLGDSGR